MTASEIDDGEYDFENKLNSSSAQPDTICSTVFTSGTSGNPKGVILTNRNLLMGMGSLGHQFVPYHLNDKGAQSSFVSYLPLAHVFERALEHGAYKRGMCIYYSSGSIKNLTKDMSLAKPSMMIGVPRVYQKIYDSVMRKVAAQPFPVRVIFHTAYAIKNAYVKCGGYKQLPLVDKVFDSIHSALGGNMEFIVSGSSALPMNVL